jgi:D-alanyl-D-alanine carboxypeptidase (penicillin-binding protein 5/6)
VAVRRWARRVLAAVLAALAPAAALALVPAVAGVAQLATSTPPPTPVLLPNGSTTLSPFPSSLRTPEPSRRPPAISAPSAILADLDSGQILYEKAADEPRPIASLTKIATALLVLERTRPHDLVTVSPQAAGDGRTAGVAELGLVPGERIAVEHLLYALLLQSANDAAVALAEHVSGSADAFVRAMNARVRRLGATDTRLASPSGLDDSGASTARDLVRITRAAYRMPGFASIVATRTKQIPAPDGQPPRVVQNRNALLWLYPGAIGTKTGFTSRAGYCIVAAAARGGVRLVAVVLGAPRDAFSDAAALLDHGFFAFERREVIAAGEPLGTVEISGREVPVASGGSLVALVPRGAEVARRIAVDPGAAFPPLPGQAVGAVTVSVPDLRIGRVPLVVASVPAPPPPREPGPWWARAVGSLVRAAAAVLDALIG